MTVLLLVLGLITGVVAAARSTWSPCGLSMLSSITPFGERGRGRRYPATVAWFVGGAVLGGATLGSLAAVAAVAVVELGGGRHPAVVAGVGAAVAAGGAAVDAGCFGPVLPLVRRQVDDGWLLRYRPWVYGGGFGWQIGVGLATYLMTAAVVVVMLFAALSASPAAAVVVGAGFGMARGLTVLLTARAQSPAKLRHLHRRLDAAAGPIRRASIGVQAAAGLALALVASRAIGEGDVSIAVAVAIGGAAAGALAPLARRRRRPVPAAAGHAVGDRLGVIGTDPALGA